MPSSAIVDFHNHFIDPSIGLNARWKDVEASLTDARALVDSMKSACIDARVISAPPEFLEDDASPALNDAISELVQANPGRLYGLATVDAYRGEAGASELKRAVTKLGLRGVFIESGRNGLLPDASEALPTLAAAAELGVPVFLHPVPVPELKARFAHCGRLSERLVRSTINSAAILALIDAGRFAELPRLRVVVTALALGGLLFAPKTRGVYVDTTGFAPATIRAAVDLLGADHVLMGTDWPIVVEASVPQRMSMILGTEDSRKVLGENALRLLGAA